MIRLSGSTFSARVRERFRIRSREHSERAFTLAEIIVAATVIITVLVAVGVGQSGAFRNATNLENRTKATQLMNDTIAVAKQAPYRQVFTPEEEVLPDRIGEGKCTPVDAREAQVNASDTGLLWASTGESAVDGTENLPFGASSGGDPGPLGYCQTEVFTSGGANSTGVGATFYVETVVAYVTSEAGMGSTSWAADTEGYTAKRVFVTVRWTDVGSGDRGFSEVSSDAILVPMPNECPPSSLPWGGIRPDPTSDPTGGDPGTTGAGGGVRYPNGCATP